MRRKRRKRRREENNFVLKPFKNLNKEIESVPTKNFKPQPIKKQQQQKYSLNNSVSNENKKAITQPQNETSR